MAGLRLRLLPRGMAGWALLILINVLLLMSFGLLVAIKLVGQQVASFAERDTIADRVYVLDRMFRAAPVTLWPDLVASLDSPNFHVRLTPPSATLLAEREREKPLLQASEIAFEAWRDKTLAEELLRIGKREESLKVQAQALERAHASIELMRPLVQSPDPIIASVAETSIRDVEDAIAMRDGWLPGDVASVLKWGLQFVTSGLRPNTAVLVPAFTNDMPFKIAMAMEIHAARLNAMRDDHPPAKGAVLTTVQTQRVSPFVRAWYGERFDERPYLLRSPDNPSTLRVVLPTSAGQWIMIDAGRAQAFVADLTPLVIGFLVAGVIVTLAAGFAIMRLTAPLGRFAEATERLGRDVNAPPLAVSGPAEVRQAARAFNEMQARIQAYVRDRTTMLAAISHDLRTPLTRLRLRGEFMDEDQQPRYYRDLDEMEAMITAAMDFAKDDARSEVAEAVDIAGLAQDLAQGMVEAGKAVEVTCGPAPVIAQVRPMAFRRALANLIENAVTYGKVARVCVSGGRRAVTIIVDDDGPGIPEDQREQVFAPFHRLETSRNRKTGGVGLGLATVRSVIRSHGGDVVLSNRPEGGLRAVITLPQ